MKMKLYTRSRDGVLYNATAEYDNGTVIVKKGSKINRQDAPGFRPRKSYSDIRSDDNLFENECYLKRDVSFGSLSTSASFVTGRVANGYIVWKTEDGKYAKYTLREETK